VARSISASAVDITQPAKSATERSVALSAGLMYPLIILLSFLGAYAVENRLWGMWLALAFGVIGYFMKRYGYPAPPVILGLIIGGIMEEALVQTSSISGGDFTIFLNRPIALLLFGFALVIILGPFIIKAVKGLTRGRR